MRAVFLFVVVTLCYGVSVTVAWPPSSGSQADFLDGTDAAGLGPTMNFRALASGDWDNDQKTDIVAVSTRNPGWLLVYRWNSGGSRFEPIVNATFRASIQYATLADLDRDGRTDVVVTLVDGEVWVGFQSNAKFVTEPMAGPVGQWNQTESGNIDPPVQVNDAASFVPESVGLVVYDGVCSMPSIYGVTPDGRSYLVEFTFGSSGGSCSFSHAVSQSSAFREVLADNAGPIFATPDIDGDCRADFVLSKTTPSPPASAGPAPLIEKNMTLFMVNAGNLSSLNPVVTYPAHAVGRPSFADWNRDGVADIVFPVRLDSTGVLCANCTSNDEFNYLVMLPNNVARSPCTDGDCCRGSGYRFDDLVAGRSVFDTVAWWMPLDPSCSPGVALPSDVVVRPGDYNDDGRLDAVARSNKGPLVLRGNNGGAPTCRTLSSVIGASVDHLPQLQQWQDPFFFDIDSDGRLALLSSGVNATATGVYAYRSNGASLGNYYLTALTVNGASATGQGHYAWGASQVGATQRFQYTDINADVHTATVTQYTSSAASALEPLRPHFGLAVTFSYITNYATGYAYGTGKKARTYPVYLMPNAQLIVVANPAKNPDDWVLELYLFGNRFMMLVLIAWLSALGALGMPLAALKFREVQLDRAELHRHQ